MHAKLCFLLPSLGLILAACAPPPPEAVPFLNLAEAQPGQIRVAGFELPAEATITIDAVGRATGSDDRVAAQGWILNRDTRRAVWRMDAKRSVTSFGDLSLYASHTSLQLAAGHYEVYLATGDYRGGGLPGLPRLARFVAHLGHDLTPEAAAASLARCHIELSAPPPTTPSLYTPAQEMPGTLLALTHIGNHEHREAGFVLDRPMTLRVYAVFERFPGQRASADAAWITRLRYRERVWEPGPAGIARGGGAAKNAVVDTTVELAAGAYALSFASDDSHAYPDFNADPPDDPSNWGVTLMTTTESDAAAFHRLELARPEPLLDARRVGDNERRRLAFRLRRDGVLWVKAEGEFSGGDGYDHGWITAAAGGAPLWSMSQDNTVAGGGAAKNRTFDGLVRLPAGDYALCYVSDDSHSHAKWNSAAPFDPEGWGIALYPGPDFDPADFQILAEAEPAPRAQARAEAP